TSFGGPSVAAQSIPEGDSGKPHSIAIPIVFTMPASSAGSLTLAIHPENATYGTPRFVGADYGGKLTRTVSYKAGTTLKIVTVAIYPDVNPEADESFHVYLGNPNFPQSQQDGLITILGDE